jgi:hypothetical protein
VNGDEQGNLDCVNKGGLVTKADIFEKVSATTGISKKESAELVEAVFSLII